MNKKTIKILKIIITFLVIVMMCTDVFANGLVASYKGTTNPEGTSKVTKIISAVLSVIRTVGAGLSVLILMVIGCKYMLASAGERAEIKKYAVTYIIGAVVLFASSTLIGIIKVFIDSAFQ